MRNLYSTIKRMRESGAPLPRRLAAAAARRLLRKFGLTMNLIPRQLDYDSWAATFDAISAEDLEALAVHLEGVDHLPPISVLVPVADTTENDLVRSLDSALAQVYPHFEICAAINESSSVLGCVLDSYASRDPRIKVTRTAAPTETAALEEAGDGERAGGWDVGGQGAAGDGEARIMNAAADLATGTYVALLHPGAMLAPHALAATGLEAAAHPDAVLIYSDEDVISALPRAGDRSGRKVRLQPFFKPDFDPELILAYNYISHMAAFRIEALRSAGGFRSGFEGALEWDLTLRIIESAAGDRVRHVPRVLYHDHPATPASGRSGRSHPTVGPLVPVGDPAATSAATRAVSEHFARLGIRAGVSARQLPADTEHEPPLAARPPGPGPGPPSTRRSGEQPPGPGDADPGGNADPAGSPVPPSAGARTDSAPGDTSTSSGYLSIEYALETPPLVSIVICTRDGEYFRRCIESIRGNTVYAPYEIVIVDNGSETPDCLSYLEHLTSTGCTVIRHDAAFNYSELNNLGVEHARGDLVLLMNDDVEAIQQDWLMTMARHAVKPGVGAVGAKLLFPNGTIQHSGVLLGIGHSWGSVAGHAHKGLPAGDPGYFGRAMITHCYSAVTAACLLVKRSIYRELGGLDEENLAIALNDVDFCLRARENGYRNVYAAGAVLVHHESASRGSDHPSPFAMRPERAEREIGYLKWKWAAELLTDPSYNPNLSLDSERFELGGAPRVAPLFPAR